MRTVKLLPFAAATLGLVLGVVGKAQASFLTSTFTSGVDNVFEDQSREAYFDVNSSGFFDVGDVLVGFNRLDDKTAPNAIPLNNRVYSIFTQEVTALVPVSPISFGALFGPTTVPGLRLSDLVPGTAATDMIAVLSDAGGFGGVNLITTSPGDLTGGGITMADYFAHILATGTLDLTATISDPVTCAGGDCFDSLVTTGGAALSTLALEALANITITNFVAGLEVTTDPAGFTLADAVLAGIGPSTGFLTIAELSIFNGAAAGTAGLVNELEWTDGSEFGAFTQCPGGPCGFANDADFVVHPVAVPEPASVALLGVGLLGLGAARRSARRRQS